MSRYLNRPYNKIRPLTFKTNINNYAEGSCLVSSGNTQIICTASFEDKVPGFLRNKNKGWLTAQYGMIPRSTQDRMNREAQIGKQSGRTQEIQRLIGRSLRSIIDLRLLGENQIIIDCDVIQADGGTRTAAINGAYIALYLCIRTLLKQKKLKTNPLTAQIAAISCGISNHQAMVDLDYIEDSNIDVDANFIMNNNNEVIEIQASSEKNSFNKDEFLAMYELADNSCQEIFALQNQAISNN
jgi:ribonuclease PH